ncbi:MAG: GFA family protein [Gammaproteobacteria bacterium]
MTPGVAFPADGGCDCRAVRYRMHTAPLVVHCCHCRWCQRETGSAFALNAMIESDRVTHLGIEPEIVDTPSESGLGQRIARCPRCRVAVWSHYAGAGPLTRFVRVGTLDDPDRLPPDVHIFTASKQPWVVLPPGARAFDAYYDRDEVWSPASLERRRALLPRIEAYRAALARRTDGDA